MSTGLWSEDKTGGNGMYKHGLAGKNILSVAQFNREQLEEILRLSHDMATTVARFGAVQPLHGKVLANLFYEPSTRTSSSFIAAMQRLGGTVIPINNVQFSSVAKGESLRDTVRTLAAYADIVVLRHPETGAANTAASALERYEFRIPIINAGDGIGEHPTQALLDLMTIKEERGSVDGLHIAMVGDLKNGRTVHSLSQLLALYEDIHFTLVSPESLRMPSATVAFLNEHNCGIKETDSLDGVLEEAGVLYDTRVQKERFGDPAAYEELKLSYVIDQATMKRASDTMVLMHPFPRVGEIAYEVDDDPRAAYFRQMRNGMYVRMALLAGVLGKV